MRNITVSVWFQHYLVQPIGSHTADLRKSWPLGTILNDFPETMNQNFFYKPSSQNLSADGLNWKSIANTCNKAARYCRSCETCVVGIWTSSQKFNLIFDIFGIIFCTDWYNWMFFSKNKQREFDFSVHIATLALRPQAWPHCETGAWRFSPPQTWGRDLRLVETSMLQCLINMECTYSIIYCDCINADSWFFLARLSWVVPPSSSSN
jgi:hypothetical protein